jgi:hypothetical protein
MRKKFFLLLVVALLIFPSGAFLVLPQSAAALGETGWEKWVSNPILPLGSSGAWDEIAAGEVCVIKDGTTYKMWYSGANAAGLFRIGYAESTDGISWNKHTGNPVLAVGGVGTWDEAGVASPVVIKVGSTYKMWYTGKDASEILRIGYAESTDGITWTKSTSNPVLDKGTGWEALGVGSPAVILDGGTYKMWYSGKSGSGPLGDLKIGYATSSNGINWERYSGNPVLGPGPTGSWADRGVGVASVIKDGSTYKMWFTGYTGFGGVGGTTVSRIGYAESSNGTSWTPSPSNPIITTGAAGTWEGRGVGGPAVLNDGGFYKMWFSGLDSNLAAKSGYARIPTYAAVTTALQFEVSNPGQPDDKVIGVYHRITDMLLDGNPATPTGGITSYSATATYDVAGVNILQVKGVAPFSSPAFSIDNVAGTTTYSASQTGSTPQAPLNVAYLVPKLVGSADDTYNLTMAFTAITTGGGPAAQQANAVLSNMRRGDAQQNGTVNITDAMFIAQYLALLRDLTTTNGINAASPQHNHATEGDKITIQDAMFIAQMLALLRDRYYTALF